MNAVEEKKKRHEEAVLDDVFTYCRRAEEYRKKQVLEITGEVYSGGERPDLIITRGNGSVIGLEHFRVDHHIKKDNKAQSKDAELSSWLEQKRVTFCGNHDGWLDDQTYEEAAEILGNGVLSYMQNRSAASYSDLVYSLDKRLFDRSTGHANKLEAYRDNLAEKHGKTVKAELGYLIEVRSDFGGLFLTSDYVTRKLTAGECPLFEDIYDCLERAAKEVDWILLAFYCPLGSKIVDAAIIDCRNGLFRNSCKKQNLFRTAYLGPGKYISCCKKSGSEGVRISIEGEKIKIVLENTAVDPNPGILQSTAALGAAQALNLDRRGDPFVATLPVQFFYEMLRCESKRIHGEMTEQTVQELLYEMPADKRLAYGKAFGERYGIDEQYGINTVETNLVLIVFGKDNYMNYSKWH